MGSILSFSALAFPNIDPVIVHIGPFEPRWYGLGYVVGILFAWWYGKLLLRRPQFWKNNQPPMEPNKLDDFVIWAVLGVVVGGRLGEVLFYRPDFYFANPGKIIAVWDGGMSFHGGFIGMALAMVFFALKNKINTFSMFDTIAAGVPIGLGVVRVCNFINNELWGREAFTIPWAVLFPGEAGGIPRHPSQIYEALTEGLLLFIVLAIIIFAFKALKKPGLVSGTFVMGYGLARIFVEFFREPSGSFFALGWPNRDTAIHLLNADANGDWLTMGMLLSLPMVGVGLCMIIYALISNKATAQQV
ncbi:prolipoprotein diacylglyceryl transferase [Bartonella sp. HY329]|uniref:prolipoprotein diacylglyceryl transferase n=1 Tax=unclassified Bartonella TaxID=2645622 RepID=UPI0021C94AC7|nr:MULTISPECIES: prolipoprotein diacylglyceryl transferase [unclassified Bartonella]UXM95008.1 prolipoprotein diacylglyceryl transferase [Bartonella sp. HY329]UXN09331.1 prolipoprotein diacylglyceryl transferase [Bartonella sp. HY328]